VGSNIVNISFILGVCVLIFPIEVDREARRIHWPVMMAASLLFWLFLRDDLFAAWEGVVFISLMLIYIVWLVWNSRRSEQHSTEEGNNGAQHPIWRALLLLVVGIVALTLGADWFVEGAVAISRGMGVSEQLIGVTVVAIGTSLPELVTSLIAAFRKQADISLGNLVGSNIFNLLGIIGLSAVVLPIQVDHVAFFWDVMAMLGVGLLLYLLMRFGDKIGRWQGAVLMLAYLGYVVMVLQRG
jgi:cation:H+ antiporter